MNHHFPAEMLNSDWLNMIGGDAPEAADVLSLYLYLVDLSLGVVTS